MRKEFSFLYIILGGMLASPLYADLFWKQNGLAIDEITIEPLQIITVQLYCDNPTASFYNVMMGNDASSVADITQVVPLSLAGDRAYASAGAPDWWSLHCEWNPATPRPISLWGNHWDVIIKGLSVGNYSINSDYHGDGGQGSNDILSVIVTPEPCSILLLGLGGVFLRRRR